MKRWRGTKVLSIILCIVLLIVQSNITFVFAMDISDGGLTNGTTVITEFSPLDEGVAEQTVPFGTAMEDLILPEALSVTDYVYAEASAPVLEFTTIEGVSWAAEPNYDGTSGVYVFSPELTDYYILADSMPTISVTVMDQETEPVIGEPDYIDDYIDLQIMKAGLEDNPQPLTMDDLIADFNIQRPLTVRNFTIMSSVPAVKHPDTIIIGNDNENNAHTGISDGDVDSCIGGCKANYPIEVSFTLDNIPTESAYIAIKAYDVDEESGEKDYVFINDAPAGQGVAGQSIGALSGNNNEWNTTVLQIPISKLKRGKNYVSISISTGWYVIVDWMQFILDGGEEDANVSEFSIDLADAVQNGSNVEIAATVNIVQSGTTEYYTEYMLKNTAGDNLASYFGSAAGMETASLSMPLDSPTGTYVVTGLIKDKTTEAIKASDSITFDFVQGEVPIFGPKVSYTLSPSTLTNGNVTICLSAENNKLEEIKDVQIWYESGDITGSTSGSITAADQSVSESGDYAFTIKYIYNGVARTTSYIVKVSNIDKVGPVITAHDVYVMEDTSDAEAIEIIKNAITVTDNVSLPEVSYTISPSSGFAATLENKTITITAQDTVGNESVMDIILKVWPKPTQLTQPMASADGTSLTASFSSTVEYTGGSITESGFVWSVSQSPTYDVCNGKTSVIATVTKGSSITGTADNLLEGVNYYVRAYVKVGTTYYYSEQETFGIGAPQYGSFSVSTGAGDVPFDGGTAVFTISRPSDQTEGSQTVYYHTVSGTAIGDLHFQHKAGPLVFAEGEYTKTVEVPVYGVSRQYDSYIATAYQNVGRNFYFEIYKVEGGATIAADKAKKTIALDSSKQAYEEAFSQYSIVGNINPTRYDVNDGGFGGGTNINAKDTVSFNQVYNTDRAYLDATSGYYELEYTITVAEVEDCYEYTKVTDNGNQVYWVQFEHGSNTDTSSVDFTFPQASQSPISIGKTGPVYVYYDSSGNDPDLWHKSNFRPYIRAVDTAKPKLLAVAPMMGRTYTYGDEVYVSLIFNEIVGIDSDVIPIWTNLSDSIFSYLEGAGTNVLVFKGTVTKEGISSSSVEVTSTASFINIKDLANNIAYDTDTTISTDADVNTVRPTISFTGSTAGTLPRHNAIVEIDSAVSAKYAWTQSTAMPASGWINFSSAAGGTLTEALPSGTLYLHVLATHENGNTRWEHLQFEFEQPTMSVTVDNADWAQSRNIELTINACTPVSVSMTGEGTGTYTAGQNINVTANGTYTFDLTDGYGSSIVKSVEVSGIDRTSPDITINEYGNTGIKYTSLDFGASAADEEGGSGLSSLQYVWTDSTAVPAFGWTAMSLTGDSIPTYNTIGTAYIHIKAVDNAGNIAYACSQGYTVMNNTPPAIEVTGGAISVWQKESVILGYNVTKTGAAIVYINAADTVMQDVSLPAVYPYNGSISISENGMYTFMVMDENGLSDTKNVVVNYIDNEAPVASFNYGSGDSATNWAQSKTITVNASDDTSPVVDSNGAITSYSGSGLVSVEWKKASDASYMTISNGGSFYTDQNGIYYVRMTDNVGNTSEYTLSISGIDTIGPVVSITTAAAWRSTVYNAMVIYSDDYSSIASAKYAIIGNNVEAPTELLDLPESGGSVTVSDDGSSYIYYKVTDNAGNVASGWSDAINIDSVTPELTVSANKGTAEGEAYISGEGTKDDVVFTLGNAATQISGTTYLVSIDGRAYENIAGSTCTISEDTNTAYRFKAVSGSGKESSIISYTVKLDKTDPSINVSDNPTAWQNTDAVLTLGLSDPGISGHTVTVSKDGSEPAVISGTTYTVSANGSYVFTVTTGAGETDSRIINVTYIDKLAPGTPIITDAPEGWQNSAAAFTVEAYDAIADADYGKSEIASFTYSIDGGVNWSSPQPWNIDGLNQFTVDATGEYTDKIMVKAADNAGNTSAESVPYTLKLDKVTPELRVSANKGAAEGETYTSGEWTNDDIVFTLGNAATQISGTTYQVSIDGGAYENIAGSACTISEDTNTAYRFKAVSGSGKESSVISYTVKLDKTDPSINVSGNPTAWQNTDAVLTLELSDPGISGHTVTVSKDGSEPAVISGTTYTVSANGSYVFTVTTGAGETDSRIINVTYIDKLAPGTPIITDAPEGWQNSAAAFTVEAYDAIADADYGKSEIASFTYSIDGGVNWSSPQPWNIDGLNQFTVDATGEYTDKIIVKAADNAGNTSAESVPYTLKLDKVAPELTVSANKGAAEGEAYTSGEWTNDDIVFTLGNAATQISGTAYQVSIGGGGYETITGNTCTISEDTNTTYRFKAVSGSGKESNIISYTVNCDNILPAIMAVTPVNGSIDQSITPTISFSADEPLVKGDGYLTIYSKSTNVKVKDIHSSNNRVKLSNENKTVDVMLDQMLVRGGEYYVIVDKAFVTDRAGNEAEAFGGKDIWNFRTASNPVIPDSEIVVLGYTVELISKAGADGAETSQTLAAVTDKEDAKQHNIVAKANYCENGTDYYVKLKVTPTMSAAPEIINLLTTEGTAVLSGDKKYIDVLIPQDAREAVVTISLGSDGNNRFSIKIINSSYRAVVETSVGISAAADESNLLNSVDLSDEIEMSKLPGTTVDVTIKLVVEQKEIEEIPEAERIQEYVPEANLMFLDITLEKVVTTKVEDISTTTETEAITTTQQPVVIIIDLPLELRGRYTYKIIREHNGVIDILPAVVIDEGTRLRFETDRFSTYSIAYTERPSNERHTEAILISSDINHETISSITAKGNQMAVDTAKLNINNKASGDINTLVPYYVENNEENVVGLSAVVDGQLKWVSQEGRTYWFKYNNKIFKDIQTHWAKNDIQFVSARELFNGTAEGIFSPDASMTRGMFVTVLGRLLGVSKKGPAASSFTDVAPDAWYAPYVGWAAEAGIVSGYGNGMFGPDDEITSEQMAAIINRFAQYTGLEPNIESQDILFDTKGTATRGEVAAVLKRFIENVSD